MMDSLREIKSVTVHWSESDYVNKVLGCDDNCDIEKEVDVFAFDSIIKKASSEVGVGYDKTSLTIVLNNGDIYSDNEKFNLTKKRDTLLKLISDD